MKKIIIYFLIWLAVLVAVGKMSPDFSTFQAYVSRTCFHRSEPSFSRWDSAWYLHIAEKGYYFSKDKTSPAVFFPFYPLTIDAIHSLVQERLPFLAFALSIIYAFLAVIVVYKLMRLDYDDKTSQQILLVFLLFPSSYFLIAVYPESLFILLAALTLLSARWQKWWLAGITGAMLALTKPYGILLWPTLVLEYLTYQGWTWKSWRSKISKIFKDYNFIPLVFPPSAFIGFMVYNFEKFGTPIAFLLAQKPYGRATGNPISNIILEAKVNLFSGYIRGWNFPYFIYFFAFIFSIWAFFASWKRVRKTYLLFSGLVLLTAISTGTLVSWNRYMFMGFPLLIGPAIYLRDKKILNAIYLTVSFAALVFIASLFVRCYPVF